MKKRRLFKTGVFLYVIILATSISHALIFRSINITGVITTEDLRPPLPPEPAPAPSIPDAEEITVPDDLPPPDTDQDNEPDESKEPENPTTEEPAPDESTTEGSVSEGSATEGESEQSVSEY